MTFPGPDALGRGLVLGVDDEAPAPFTGREPLVVDATVLTDPAPMADRIHRAWRGRERYLVRLAVPVEQLTAPEVERRPPYELDADFEFARTRLRYLILANAYWAVGMTPTWQLTELALRLGCSPGTSTDVRLPDGCDVWLDGGPREDVADLPLLHRDTLELGSLQPRPAIPVDHDLAPDQRGAIEHGSGPARIIAPAGSGKTRVLTARLRELLAGRGHEPTIVTAVAYNNRAAAEMRARTDGLGANIRTLHSLGLSICNRFGRRRLLDEREIRDRLERLVRVARQQNQDPLAPYLEALGEVRLGLRHPEDVEAERDDVDGFAAAFDRYRDGLARDGVMDFDEQIYGAIEVLLTEPRIRAEVQRSCRYLLVDEFQDLTPAFLMLVRLVSAPTWDVFGVGDDDQVIYGYVGATPRYLIDYRELFPEAAAYALELNYRCAPGVVAAASNLLSHNLERIDKTIHAAPGRAAHDDDLRVEAVPTRELAGRAVDLLQGWRDDGTDATAVVLGRVNSVLLPVQVALSERGVGHSAPLDRNVLQRTGLRAALAWLRVGLDPERMSNRDVEEVLKRPSRQLTTVLRDRLRSRPRWSLTGLDELADRADLSGAQAGRLTEFLADIEDLTDRITQGADTAACLAFIRHDIGLDDAATLLDGRAVRGSASSSHADDLDALEQLAPLHPDPGGFERWLREALAVPADPDGVLLSTIHRVKGLEWDRVLVVGATASLFPHHLADSVEEERRIFHVAITRSRRHTVVLADADRPSPFLDELEKRRRPDERPLQLARPSAPASRPQPAVFEPVGSADPEVFEALRAWRTERARQDGLPAYIIASNAMLEDVAVRLPATLAELRRCHGIGPKKLDLYGEEILAVLESQGRT
ncbi:MAG: ATP-dependent DNA helicase UvrD2 [Actinobacteria bacterium]|nr:ATP-dependent DNA helicase UvrD2 [Actinomycetota bacterium]